MSIVRLPSLSHRVRRILPFAALPLLYLSIDCNMQAQTQTFSAGLTGVVSDSAGSAVPKANVNITSVDRGLKRTYQTSDDGRYTFTLLPPGKYALTVESPGMQTYSRAGIELAVGQSASLDVTLNVGNISQTVEVTDQAPLLNTSDANISSNVNQRAAVELPLNWRNVYGLVFLNSSVNNGQHTQWQAGGAYQGNADQDVAFFNFGGGRFGNTAFLLDGHWDVGPDWGGVAYVPGVDELQEMKLQTNTFSAQYGWSMGNVVNAITKSGTNEFHGDVFEFLRNSALDANNYFNNAAGIARPQFHRNQFGITAGGPLFIPHLYSHKDKTYLFGIYEGLRQQTPVTLVTTVPAATLRGGDFSGVGQIYNPFTTRPAGGGFVRDPFPGNHIPAALIDPVAAKIVNFWPSPTGVGLINNYTATGPSPTASDQYTIRADQNISDATRLFVRWSQKREFKQEVAPLFGSANRGGPGSRNPNNRWDGAFNFNHVFSPTFVLSLNFGWNRWVEGGIRQGSPFDVTTLGLPAFLNASPGVFPGISVDGVNGLGSGGNGSNPRENRTYSIDFTKVRGAHAMNFGFTVVDMQQNSINQPSATFNFPVSMTAGPDPTAPAAGTGYGFASFLLGTANSGNFSQSASPALKKRYYGWYMQDDWRVNRRLTLNIGLRYDFQLPFTDRFDRLTWFDFAGINPISAAAGIQVPGHLVYAGGGNRRGAYEPQFTNAAPRFGLSYKISDKLVLRSGFGISYSTAMTLSPGGGIMPGFSTTTPFTGTTDGITPVSTLSNPFPHGLVPATGKADGELTNVGRDVNAIENYRPTPYAEQWTIGLQYALGRNDSLEVQYVGNHGVKLPISGGLERNQIPDSALALGNGLLNEVKNPFYGLISSSGCGLDQPNVTRGQLLRPYPEYCSVQSQQVPGGFSTYHALQLNYNHHWSNGLQLLASFTASKFIDNTSGSEAWSSLPGPQFRDNNNLAAEKSLDSDDIPKSLVINYVYELPLGKGKRFGGNMNKPLNAVIGGWQVSGISTFKDGFPLAIYGVNNNTGSFGGNQRPNIVGNPAVSNPTINAWFNTAAFALPAPYTFGNTPRTMPHLRSPGTNTWDIAIQKWWELPEKVRVQLRAEMFNAFNHTRFTAPNTAFGNPQFGIISSAFAPRDVQAGLKVYW